MDGSSVRLIGTQIRLLDASTGTPRDLQAGWPPNHPDMLGGVDPNGFVIPAPPGMPGRERDDGRVYIEILFGYEVINEGRTVRKGVYVTYEFEGKQHKVFLPSYAALCAPMTMKCDHEDHNGPDKGSGREGDILPSWNPSATP